LVWVVHDAGVVVIVVAGRSVGRAQRLGLAGGSRLGGGAAGASAVTQSRKFQQTHHNQSAQRRSLSALQTTTQSAITQQHSKHANYWAKPNYSNHDENSCGTTKPTPH